MSEAARRSSSVDGVQLRALLRCYFHLSSRGKITQVLSRGTGRPRGLVLVAVLYLLGGLMVGQLAFHADVFTYALVIHCMTFFVVGMAVTAESGDVLFNAKENDVLGHRPIHPRTLLLAKSLHLIGFALILAGALNVFPTFLGLAARGARRWFPLAHVFSIVLTGVFCSAAVVCIYGLIVRLFDREKFDNFAAWAQVGMSILFAIGYQLMAPLMPHLEHLNVAAYSSWLLPLPPAWFAAIDAFAGGQPTTPIVGLLAPIALLSTAALTYMAIGKLAQSYGEAVATLGEERQRSAKSHRVRSLRQNRNPLLRWWLRDSVEYAAFRLAAIYMRRDREIKLRLYPSLSVFVLFPVAAIMSRHEGFSWLIPMLTIWMLCTVPIAALEVLRMSSQHTATEIFAIAPLASAAPVFHGARKATMYYLVAPAVCISGVLIGCFVADGAAMLWLGLPGLIALPTISLAPGLFSDYLPLSQPPLRGEQTARNSVLMFAGMLMMGVVVGVTYLAWRLKFFLILVAVETVMVSALHYASVRHIKNRPMCRSVGE